MLLAINANIYIKDVLIVSTRATPCIFGLLRNSSKRAYYKNCIQLQSVAIANYYCDH